MPCRRSSTTFKRSLCCQRAL
uniref:Uncharacterized protein n=1 Tax=Arundo donax TaxID=35708 RepID=A0A0A9CZV3_ARUDO